MTGGDGRQDGRQGRRTASVVIPAHNEALVIERCLRSILADPRADELDIVVACNGCTDDTESIAAAVHPSIRVVSTQRASKWGALDLGDANAVGFPRMYVDADVIVSTGAVSSLADAMTTSGAAIGAPRLRFPDQSGSSVLVRRFYDGWKLSPYFDDKLVGFGFYALSEEGRSRFGAFPETMAEDYLLHRMFGRSERHVDDAHWFTPLLPATLRDVVGVQSRQLAANAGLASFADREGHAIDDHHRPFTWIGRAARDPRHWPSLAVFVGVRVAAMVESRRRQRRNVQVWTRDRSSHGSAPAASDHAGNGRADEP